MGAVRIGAVASRWEIFPHFQAGGHDADAAREQRHRRACLGAALDDVRGSLSRLFLSRSAARSTSCGRVVGAAIAHAVVWPLDLLLKGCRRPQSQSSVPPVKIYRICSFSRQRPGRSSVVVTTIFVRLIFPSRRILFQDEPTYHPPPMMSHPRALSSSNRRSKGHHPAPRAKRRTFMTVRVKIPP